MLNNNKGDPIGLNNNPLVKNPLTIFPGDSGFPINGSDFRITDDGDFRITDSGDRRVTDL